MGTSLACNVGISSDEMSSNTDISCQRINITNSKSMNDLS